MGSELIIFLVAGIISLILMSFSLGVVITLHFNKEGDNIFTEKRNIDVTNIILKKESYNDVNALIDAFIKDAIELYRILNVVVEETYLTKDKIKEMEGYVYKTVMSKMTKDIVDTISIFYVIDSDEDLENIIKLRIKLHLIQSAVEQNKPIDE